MSDSVLQRIVAGDPDAVAQCLRRFTPAVWSLARRLSPTEHDAEDAVQEIFLDLWRSAGRFDPALGTELTFVLTIARRRLIDRSRRRPRAAPVAEDVLDAHPTNDAPISRPAEIDDETARVQAAMQHLRPEQRTVLELSLVGGQTHQQIAGSLNMALGTVKSHARRGLMRVRELLGLPPLLDQASTTEEVRS